MSADTYNKLTCFKKTLKTRSGGKDQYSFHGPRLGSYHDGNLNRSIFLCYNKYRICVYNYNNYYLIQWEICCFKFRIVNSSKYV